MSEAVRTKAQREEVPLILEELRHGKSAVSIAFARGLTLGAVCAVRNEALASGELKTNDLWEEGKT